MASTEQWRTFFRQCLTNRVDVNEFRDLSKLLFSRCSIPEATLLDALLESQDGTAIKWDPLLPLYIDVLCKTGRVKVPTVLTSLLKHSSICEKAPEIHGKNSKRYTLMTDIKVIQDIMLSASTGNIPRSLTDAVSLLSVVADWIQAVLAWNNSRVDNAQQEGLMNSPDAVSLFESLGILLAVLSGAGKGLEVLTTDSQEGIFLMSCDSDAADFTRPQDQAGSDSLGLSSSVCSSLAATSQQTRLPTEGTESLRGAGTQVIGLHDGQCQCQCTSIRGHCHGRACYQLESWALRIYKCNGIHHPILWLRVADYVAYWASVGRR